MEEKKILLELTAEEFLFIQEKVCIPTPYNWGGYQWEHDIEKSVIQKLDAAYVKPTLTAEEYNKKMEEEAEYWKGSGCKMAMLAAARRNLHFHFQIEGEEENHGIEYGDDDT